MYKTIAVSFGLITLGFYATFGVAQEAGGDLSLGEDVVPSIQIGDQYEKEKFGDWSVRCIKTGDANDPCQMFQLLNDEAGNSVAEVNITPLKDQGIAVAGANVTTPLETLLPAQLTIDIDGKTAKRYPFAFCSVVGCVSRLGLTVEDLAGYKNGITGKFIIVPAATPQTPVELNLSLTGFTAAYDSLVDALK